MGSDWLAIVVFVSTILLVLLRYLKTSGDKARWYGTFVSEKELMKKATAITEGRLCKLDHEYFESATGSDDDLDVEHFVVYEYTLREGGEEKTYTGRQRIREKVTRQPGFPMKIGRPVRVRYRLDDPGISRIEDDDL